MGRARKIAVFLPSAAGGGAERAMILFAAEASRQGCDVDIIFAQKKGVLLDELPTSARVIDLSAPRMLLSVRKLARYLSAEQPEALFSTIIHANLAALLARFVSRAKTKIVIRESNAPISERKQTISRRMTHMLAPWLYPWADAIIAVSEGVAGQLRLMNGRLSPTVLPSPVISEEILQQANEPLDHPWFQSQALPVVIGVGRLHYQKNFELLIRAFATVRQRHPCRLVILGEGPERAKLEALVGELGIEEHVQLPGFLPNPFPYIRRAQVFALSSRYEGMPNVLIQAMALGTPVIATDCPHGPREATEQGTLGALVAEGDELAFTHALESALSAPRQESTAQRTIERFGVSQATQNYLSMIMSQT